MRVFWGSFKFGISFHSILIPLCCLALLITGCGDSSQSSSLFLHPQKPTVNIVAADSPTAAHLPAMGILSATVNAACLNGGQPAVLSDDGAGNFRGSFTNNITTGDCTFDVTLAFEDPDYGAVEVATASKTVAIKRGSNDVVVSSNDYSFADVDGDGVSNLSELDVSSRTNPFTRPVWGEFTWSEERWTP